MLSMPGRSLMQGIDSLSSVRIVYKLWQISFVEVCCLYCSNFQVTEANSVVGSALTHPGLNWGAFFVIKKNACNPSSL
jgi:hypothetical protein